jgi:hypothetical protein
VSRLFINYEKFPDFRKLKNGWPRVAVKALFFVSARLMNYIVKHSLSGQVMDYHFRGAGAPVSRAEFGGARLRSFGRPNRGGRKMLRYGVMKNGGGVYVRSRPFLYKIGEITADMRSKLDAGRLQSWLQPAIMAAAEKDAAFEDFEVK